MSTWMNVIILLFLKRAKTCKKGQLHEFLPLEATDLEFCQPSKLEERKKVRLSKEALTKTDFVYALSTLTSGHFGTTGS